MLCRTVGIVMSTAPLLQRLTSYSPYLSRHTKMHRSAASGYFTTKAKQRFFGDPTPTTSSKNVVLFRCPSCFRVRHVHKGEASMRFFCCEGQIMRKQGTIHSAVNLHRRLVQVSRIYDPVAMRPRSRLHKPASKHRSKLPKS